MDRFLAVVLYFLSGFVPRKRKKVILGAWLGKKFSDNPKYLLIYLARQRPDLDLVWVGDESVRPTIPSEIPVRFVRRGSVKSWQEMLTAGNCFVTHSFFDLGKFNLMRGAVRVYLGHGLAIKHMGSRDQGSHGALFTAIRRTIRQTYAFDHYVACSPAHREKLLVENAPWNILSSQVVECGQPRCDFLIENCEPSRRDDFKTRFLTKHGLPANRTIITYLPTFRDSGQSAFSFATLSAADRQRFDQLLEGLNAVLVEKSHFQESVHGSDAGAAIKSARVFALKGSDNVDTQELLLASDLLITDYSGCYVDFLVMRRPIVHFAYDRKYYESKDRGLYFNLNDVAGGPIVEDFNTLCAVIEDSLRGSSNTQRDRERVRLYLTEFERGTASFQIAERVFRN